MMNVKVNLLRAQRVALFVVAQVVLFGAASSVRSVAQTPPTPAPVPAPAVQSEVPSAKVLDGITFASRPGQLYVPIKDLGIATGQDVSEDMGSRNLKFAGHILSDVRYLFDGTGLVSIHELAHLGATVNWNEPTATATVQYQKSTVSIHRGGKSVTVDKGTQALYAYQGPRLVLASHVSTGREGHGTPNGHFTAGPTKERMHLSRLYNFAPMPWSVQVQGNVFIHGFTSVPNHPASHGCIRMQLTRGNPAHYFFNWVDIGTPVTIKGIWGSHFASSGHHHLAMSRRHHRHGHRFTLRRHHHRRGHSSRFARRHKAGSITPGFKAPVSTMSAHPVTP